MKYLVIGLGSMGKRRIRNLLANNERDIIGMDLREDRRVEVQERFGIQTYQNIDQVNDLDKIDAFIISVPPDKHMDYAHFAVDRGIHCFIEASVTDEGMKELIQKMKQNSNVKVCPSCTLKFHPSIKLIKALINDGKIGKVSNFSYHSGQYLPDWHPWEKITDYYVSKKETGACREIVPFELTWLNDIFGDIEGLFGFKGKTIELGVDIDDVYAVTLKYQRGILGTLVVDTVARYAVRRLIVNGEEGQIQWDWNKKCVELYDAKEGRWIYYHEPQGKAETGYHANIIEEMYIAEIRNFINCIQGKETFKNSLEEDYRILQYLYSIEKANDQGMCFYFEK